MDEETKDLSREKMYTITLLGGVEITTRGYKLVEISNQTLIGDSSNKPVFMVDTKSIVKVSSTNMPYFS